MKSTILTLFIFLLSISLASAQSQLPLKSDTTATPKLRFNTQNHWSLPLKDSLAVRDFDFQTPKNIEPNLATTFSNMPVIVPDSNHSMPVYTPDTTVTYKMQILSID